MRKRLEPVPPKFRGARTREVDRVIGMIQTWAAVNRLRPQTIAKAARLSPRALRTMYDPKWSPTVRTLRLLENYMQFYEASHAA